MVSVKTVQIKYFAQLKEERGTAAEDWRTQCSSLAELYAELQKEYGFSLSSGSVRAALNGDYAEWGAGLKDRDEVVFIPPVAGG